MALPADAAIAGMLDLGDLALEILDRIQDGFYAIDRDWQFVYANRAACEMWGIPRDEILGRVLWERFPQMAGSESGRLLRRAVESRGAAEFESLSPVVGRWLWLRVDPIRAGITGVLWRDITERKAGEEKLRELTAALEARVAERTRELAETNDRLRRERLLSELIIENTAEGIIVVDTELRHLVWNAGMENINGLPRSAVLGKTSLELFPYLADHPIGQAWRDALAGRRSEMRDRRYSSPVRGREIIYDADFAPLHDQTGAIIGAVGIVRDTTERHRIEERLRQSQKLEAVAQLTGGVAHDFNNLLTAVIGCLDTIVREGQNERIASLAGTALRSANRGARLVRQLLAFARSQALQPVSADLNALLAEIDVLLRRAVGETVEIAIAGAPDLWRCEVDPAQFEAAILNLVMNARDAMPRGGRLTLRTGNVEIRDAPAAFDLRSGDYVAVSVSDTGDGMTPEVMARAFEPFYTTKEIGRGSGLGLSMVYGFAKQSGGGVELDSAPGTGTRFTLYLPRAAPPAAASDRDGPADEPQRGSGVVLVVEDDEDVREVSVAMLEGLGYRVCVAGNGREALEALRRPERVDLLFTDLVMPGGLSGAALAQQARELQPGLKILLTTGYGRLEGPEAEEFPILPKPFRPAQLSRAVAALMEDGKPDELQAAAGTQSRKRRTRASEK